MSQKLMFLLSFLICIGATSYAQNLATYKGGKVTVDEFKNYYLRNSPNPEAAKNDSIGKLKNFLDLYVNFKLKLEDAISKNYPKNKEIITELNDYKKKIGVSFLLEKDLVMPGIKQLYDRRLKELRVSHIMLKPDSTGEASVILKGKAILDSINKGLITFERAAENNSIDTYSKNLGGDIFWISAGMLPVEFEDAAYETPVGKIDQNIIKTRFGYHIIKVTAEQPRVPQIRASHILVDFYDEKGNLDTAFALARVDSALTMLKNGTPFDQVAKRFSKDPGSKDIGGDLGWFERRMMVKEFDEAAFKLKVGEISEPVKTTYGFHIIKLLEKGKVTPFEEQKEDLKKLYKQTRYPAENEAFVNKLRTKYNYKINDPNLQAMLKLADTVRVSDDNPKAPMYNDKELFSYAGKSYKAKDVIDALRDMSEFAGRYINYDAMSMGIKKLSENLLLEEESANLDKTDKEFAALMDDYKNGIYIFKLQEDEIWGKVKVDSNKLPALYEQTKNNYKWNDRVSFREIFTHNDSLANVYYLRLQNGENFDSLAYKYTERPEMKESCGLFNLVETNANLMAETAWKLKEGEYNKPFKTSNGYSIVKLITKDPARIKTFEEAKAEVIGVYQENETKRIEDQYNSYLQKKFKPVTNYNNLDKVFK